MFKKATYAFLFATILFSTTSFAQTQMLRPNMTLYFTFSPNQPEIIKNPIWWTVSANCTIESNEPSNDLRAFMLRNNGQVNDIQLTENSSIVVTVHNQEILKITAEAYAWVEITNIGKQEIKAACTTD